MSGVFNNYIVPEWISSRVYECSVDGEDVCRTYILNSKTHEYITFEDNAAKLWSFVLNADYDGLIKYAKENDLYDELDLFFDELKSQNLVVIQGYKDTLIADEVVYESVPQFEAEKFQEEMSSWIYKNGFLSSLFFEMTYLCNLKCCHCLNDKDVSQKQITFEEIKPIIDDADKLGVFSVTLSGGECTLVKDFLKIVEYIRKKKLAVSIFTNGQTLFDDEQLLDDLLSLYPNKIFLSLYSMDSKIHDKITGVKGSHHKTLSVIKKLKDKNIEVGIKCFLTKFNYSGYKEVLNFAKNIGVGITFDATLLPNQEGSNLSVGLNENQIAELYKNGENIFWNKHIKPIGNKEESIICKGARHFLCVSPNLDLYPCTSLKKKLGNLAETQLNKIWNDKNPNSNINIIKAISHKDLKECFKEAYCGYCHYCMATTKTENAFLGKSEICCKFAKITSKMLQCD